MESPDDSAWTDRVEACLDQHQGKACIRLTFAYDPDIIQHVKAIIGRQWSQTRKSWFVPDTYRNRCRFGLEVEHGMANPLQEYSSVPERNKLCRDLLQKVHDQIVLRGYSIHTLKSYVNHTKAYLQAISTQQDPITMTKGDIEQYLLMRNKQRKFSESNTNQHINAIKFLYEQVLGKERMLFYLPRPEKPLQLPKVLGEHELERLFAAVENLKHKAILLTAFSCGLRVSEVVSLRVRNLDPERMQVLIVRSKGKKDRYVTLSPVLWDVLSSYMMKYQIPKTGYLFQGQEKGEPYSIRSAQTVFNRAIKAAGINKDVTFHALRHTYATLLLEKGTDIRFIRDLLGHFDIKTTERYLHVAREKLVNIQSPLDSLNLST